MTQQTGPDRLTEELQDTLTRLYGPLLASRDLWKLLGYASPAAYRQARARKRLPVAEFEIEGRRGRFALTRDVARWLAQQRLTSSSTKKTEGDPS
ncbi:hypothetical protein [Aquitalea pelogenes]|uniref:hypothetical protein n=1 Tax=Aquitalea pelogenes TaxID=1293573 RepID=UPI00128EECE1|nr:hypothetical protein [Aquitalea pelogenes]